MTTKMPSLPAVRSATFALVVASMAACAIFDNDEVCLLRGCDSGLTVQLPSLPSGPFKIELLVLRTGTEGEASYIYECSGEDTCRQAVFFPDLTPPRVSVRVTTALGVRVTEVPSITYEQTQPNGEDCDPTCLNATITVQVPT